ncbi:alpha/beta-hydrolase [Meira miltonrushii]|uniref:Alpha/beta-hydrolase n=1 Tax=Meira miltonrushii TaxID=1280837 RepID=A0A316V592_9BASI|nr:alpha/beta-hydrolase [Meira miltonrushii]PWN32737.1 alpha/beta-hydrolase [Meira miltonrushii]
MTIKSEPGKLEQKQIKTSARGYTYGYYTSPAQDGKPTLLLLHGWPDDSSLWYTIANDALIPNGYGVIVPDCLGYSLSDKPDDYKEYDSKAMATDFAEIIKTEGIDKVIVIGHDWGSGLAQGFYFFQPEHCSALGMCNVAYIPPSTQKRDIVAMNDQFEKIYGYRCFNYMSWFASDESDAICDAHVESLFHLCHAKVDENQDPTKGNLFTTPDGIKKFIQADIKPETHPSITPQFKKHWIEKLTEGGFHAPFNYYRNFINSQGTHDNKAGPKVDVPTLFVGYSGDLVCRAENIQPSIQAGLLPNHTNTILSGGHWGLLHESDAFNEAVLKWLKSLNV